MSAISAERREARAAAVTFGEAALALHEVNKPQWQRCTASARPSAPGLPKRPTFPAKWRGSSGASEQQRSRARLSARCASGKAAQVDGCLGRLLRRRAAQRTHVQGESSTLNCVCRLHAELALCLCADRESSLADPIGSQTVQSCGRALDRHTLTKQRCDIIVAIDDPNSLVSVVRTRLHLPLLSVPEMRSRLPLTSDPCFKAANGEEYSGHSLVSRRCGECPLRAPPLPGRHYTPPGPGERRRTCRASGEGIWRRPRDFAADRIGCSRPACGRFPA